MKLVVFLILIVCTSWTGINAHALHRRLICDNDYTVEFQKSMYDFTTKFTKLVAIHSHDHFVISPLTIWLSISAIAEGAHGIAQRDLFNILNLSHEKCIRQKYYQIARSLEVPGNDVLIQRYRALVIDDSLRINPVWAELQLSESLLNITRIPIQADPNFTSSYLRHTIVTPVDLKPTGYSVLTDSLNYEGLWTTGFSDIVRGPFYNDDQQQIGIVDYMTLKKQVKLAHLAAFNAKVLELPVGHDGRYRMLITMGSENTPIGKLMSLFRSSIIAEIMDALTMSRVPIDIAIPMFGMTSEFDARFILEKLGIRDLWTDSIASRYVSAPAPVPVGLLHHASVKLDMAGVYPPPRDNTNNFASNNIMTGVSAVIERDFIADKPFMYMLIDAKYQTALFIGAYSVPTPTSEVTWTI